MAQAYALMPSQRRNSSRLDSFPNDAENTTNSQLVEAAGTNFVHVVSGLPARESTMALSSPVVVTTSLSASSAAWLRHVEKLSESEKRLFLKINVGDLGAYLGSVEQGSKDQERGSRAVRVAKLFQPIVQAIDMYAPALQTISQAGPAPSAYVLGGITCLISIPIRFLDYQEKIATMLCEMGVEFRRLSEYERTLFRDNYEVQAALLDIYGDILDFCREAAKLVYNDEGKPKGSLKTFTLALWKPYEAKLGGIVKNFKSHLNAFENLANLVVRKNTAVFFASLTQDMVQIKQDNSNIKTTLASMERKMPTDLRRGLLLDSAQRDIERRKMPAEKRDRVLTWIPNVSYNNFYRERLSKRLDGTGEWLLNDDTFAKWKSNSDELEILCVQGKSGCGKSCLAALVIDTLDKEVHSKGQNVAVAYVFCGALDDTTRSRNRIFGSILHQLLAQDKDSGADRAIERVYDTNTGKSPSPEQLEELISTVAGRFQTVFLVIDGLDECYRLGDEAFENLCKSFKSFARLTPSTIRLAIFSRPNYNLFERVFHPFPHIMVDSGANEDDIKQFIASVLSEEELLIRNNKTLLQYVEKTLLTKADGMFLWVSMLTQTLKSAQSASEIKEKIEDLPQGLHGVYEISLQRILEQRSKIVKSRAMKLLLWVTNAKRALSKEELIEALVIEPGMSDLDTDAMISRDAAITAECGDLVVLREGFYYPLHSSLQDYLFGLTKDPPNHLREFRQMQLDAQKILGEACLTYLQFDKFMDGPIQDIEALKTFKENNPFFGYAAKYWGSHLTGTLETGFEDLIDNLLSCDESRELSMQQYLLADSSPNDLCPYRSSTTPLHILAIFNLTGTAKALPELHDSKFKLDGFDRLPLDYALLGKGREMCLWLLEKSPDTEQELNADKGRYSPIHMAANNDWGDVIELLTSTGCDLTSVIGNRQQTPLHIAASMGCESAVETLLKLKVKIDPLDVDGQTPLIDAAEGNHYKIIERLLKAGANVNKRGWQGLTALHRAAVNGNVQAAQKLFRYKAEVDPKADAGWSFRTPFHIAAEDNHPELLKLLQSKGAALETECTPNFTPLLLAASSGSLAVINLLIEWGANLEASNSTKGSAMHLAALNGHTEIIKALYKARRNFVDVVDEFGEIPLHSAIRASKTEAALTLIELNSSIEKTDPKGQNALHLAILEGNTQLVEHLIIHCKADTAAKGVLGSPALNYAASYHHSNLIKLLISDGGADPEGFNDNQQTALHFAAREKDHAFVQELVRVVPSINLAPLDIQKRTPLHLAADEGASEVVRFLVERKAAISKNADKNSPFNLAAWSGNLECVKLLMTKENVNERGYYGRTPLFGAATRGHLDVIKLLLEKGADPNEFDDFSQSPLFTATKNKRMDAAQILIDANADGTTKTRWGRTALHEAASVGNCNISKQLLEAGCDGLSTSVWGDTPFLCAVDADSIELVDIFLEKSCNGTNLLNHQNVNPFHLAVGKGNVEMFDKLTKAGKVVAADFLVKDHLERDLMYYAASGGHTDMIIRLRNLGININGRESIRPPLYEAATSGYVLFVTQLLALNADLEAICHHDQRTALMGAAMDRRPICFERLLRAGADPLVRDVYGYSALDYAHKTPSVWETVGSYKDIYVPLDLEWKKKVLRKQVAKSIREILALPSAHTAQGEAARVPLMVVLTNALIELEENTSYETSLVLLKEIANPPDVSFFSVTWECNMCCQLSTRKPKFMCKSCHNIFLCDECCADYEKGDDSPKSAPKSYKIMEDLEVKLQPFQVVATTCAGLGVRFLDVALDLLVPVDYFIIKTTKEYKEWEEKYGSFYPDQPKPGLQFLKLIEKTRETRRSIQEETAADSEKKPSEENDACVPAKEHPKDHCESQESDKKEATEQKFKVLDDELTKLFRLHKADQEIAPFTCAGHDFLEIPFIDWAKADKDTGPYDSIGRTTQEWLTDLLSQYEDNQPTQVANLIGESNDLYMEPLDIEETAQVESGNKDHQTETTDSVFPKRTMTASQSEDAGSANQTQELTPDADLSVEIEPKQVLSRRATGLLEATNDIEGDEILEVVPRVTQIKQPTLDELEKVCSVSGKIQQVGELEKSDTENTKSASQAVGQTSTQEHKPVASNKQTNGEQTNESTKSLLAPRGSEVRWIDSYISELKINMRRNACRIIAQILMTPIEDEAEKSSKGKQNSNQQGEGQSTLESTLNYHAYKILTQMNLWSIGFQFAQLTVQGSVTDNLIPQMDHMRLLREEGYLSSPPKMAPETVTVMEKGGLPGDCLKAAEGAAVVIRRFMGQYEGDEELRTTQDAAELLYSKKE